MRSDVVYYTFVIRNLPKYSHKLAEIIAITSHERTVVTIMHLVKIDAFSWQEKYGTCWYNAELFNINWRDVQRNNVVKNVDMPSLRTPLQKGQYKNQHTERHSSKYPKVYCLVIFNCEKEKYFIFSLLFTIDLNDYFIVK